jgi:hypothetical protein
MGDAMRGTKICEGIGGVFSTTISSKELDLCRKLCFNRGFKVFESSKNIRFMFKQKKPTISREVIHKQEIVFISIRRRNWSRAPYITVYQL